MFAPSNRRPLTWMSSSAPKVKVRFTGRSMRTTMMRTWVGEHRACRGLQSGERGFDARSKGG